MNLVIDGVFGIYDEYSELYDEIHSKDPRAHMDLVVHLLNIRCLADFLLATVHPNNLDEAVQKATPLVCSPFRYSEEAVWSLQITTADYFEHLPARFRLALGDIFSKQTKPDSYDLVAPGEAAKDMLECAMSLDQHALSEPWKYESPAWGRFMTIVELTYYRASHVPVLSMAPLTKGQLAH